ncbi:hypothetical protein HYQ45_000194 [Verticillium longisporum]|uniref:Uncharacterized protein n=1 Tax=Verticillium longisporum TaxID=100787 RepID=A0A8I3A1T7_VERLO|nr:hypothetical protein HYQ45_000194 [Verticillium longisporum]
MIFTEPILVQACLIAFLCNAIFTNFWTTLTFLLASPPYEFSSLIIGLFSLIGLTGIVGTPLYTRLSLTARNRINTAYMICAFCGQLTGTTVGNRLYAHGGWLLSGGASVAFVGLALLAGFARGPRAKGWVGWHGGWRLRKDQ